MADTIPEGLTADDLREMYRLMLMGRRFSERAMGAGRGRPAAHGPTPQRGAGGGRRRRLLRPARHRLGAAGAQDDRGLLDARGHSAADDERHHGQRGQHLNAGKESFHHCGYPELGIIAGSAIVGAQFPTTVGTALGQKMQGTDDVTVCFFGDGAAARGDFHEGLNLAALLKVPIRLRLREQSVLPRL